MTVLHARRPLDRFERVRLSHVDLNALIGDGRVTCCGVEMIGTDTEIRLFDTGSLIAKFSRDRILDLLILAEHARLDG
jgi:hypothetical protein